MLLMEIELEPGMLEKSKIAGRTITIPRIRRLLFS